jgi:hypothetical protein
MIGCTAALSWMVHGRDGKILDLGRRRRRPNAALRKAARDDGTFTFCHPDGAPRPPSPPLPSPDGDIAGIHAADITPETIIPPWSGERLDLDYAIYTCLANDKVRADRQAGRDRHDPDGDTAARPGIAVFAPGNWYDVLCEFHAEQRGIHESKRLSLPDWMYQRTRAAASPA